MPLVFAASSLRLQLDLHAHAIRLSPWKFITRLVVHFDPFLDVLNEMICGIFFVYVLAIVAFATATADPYVKKVLDCVPVHFQFLIHYTLSHLAA